MVLMVLDARQPLDDGGHAPGGPEQRAKVVGLGPFFEGVFQLAEVFVGEARLASGSPSLFESAGATVFPSVMPAADRLPMDADGAGDLGLAQAEVEKFDGLHAPPFQLCQLRRIAFDAFRISHAQRLAQGHKHVTILCRDQ